MRVVEHIAERFGDARRRLNAVTDRSLFPLRGQWPQPATRSDSAALELPSHRGRQRAAALPALALEPGGSTAGVGP